MDLQVEVMKITEVSPQLFLGSGKHAREESSDFKKLGIKVIINCCNDFSHKRKWGYEVEEYRIDDGVFGTIIDFLDPVADSIRNHLLSNKKVYVHCMHGKSRSVSIVIYYLIKYEKMTYDQAYQMLLELRPIISPNTNFIKEIQRKEISVHF
jgi:protein-tyrosine phosphatase